VRIEESSSNIVKLSVIRTSRQRASSPYGPVRAGLTTSPDRLIPKEDPLVQLSALLNSLESEVERLNYKSFTVYDTLVIAIEAMRVALSNTQTEEDGTDV
jgi:hypothetical protein